MEQKIEAINEDERAWIALQIQAALELVNGSVGPGGCDPPGLDQLDQAFADWLASHPTDAQVINQVINAIGISLGEHLVRGLGMKWVIVTDGHGSDLAVHALPGKGDVVVYPANFVAKRWERRETNFLRKSYDSIAADIDRIGKSNARPFWKQW